MSFDVGEQLNHGVESDEVAFWFRMPQVTPDLSQQSCDRCRCTHEWVSKMGCACYLRERWMQMDLALRAM